MNIEELLRYVTRLEDVNIEYDYLVANVYNAFPELNNKKKCPFCDAKIYSYWHPITPAMVNALIKIARHIKMKGENKIHNRLECIDLSKIEWANTTKLRFHGLIAKYKESGVHLPGYWCLTNKGLEFLNRIDIPLKVKTYRNRVIDHSDETVNIEDIKKGIIQYRSDEFDMSIRQYKLI